MTRLRKSAALVLALAAAAPAAAAAAPARGSAWMRLPSIFVVQGQPVTVVGRPVAVRGYVRPYVPRQWVTLKAFQGRRLIRRERLRVRPAAGGRMGRFSGRVRATGPGSVTVTATHERTAELAHFTARRGFSALVAQAAPGSSGRFVALIQQRLAALHFYIPQSGVYDGGTELAIDAYHRLLRWGTYKTLDGRTTSYLLNGWGAFKVRYRGQGRHAEANLSQQLLALVDGSTVRMIFPVSSGKPSTPTILGSFHVYSRVPGRLPDGMYYSNFFSGGYAIHGYDPAPDYPASHGCIRLPMSDAVPAFDWLAIGDPVDVYY